MTLKELKAAMARIEKSAGFPPHASWAGSARARHRLPRRGGLSMYRSTLAGVKDPATNTPMDIPEPLPPAPPPVNPYDVPGGPKSPDPVEDVVPEKVPSKPAPSPDEDWVSEPDRDRKATVRDKPVPGRRR